MTKPEKELWIILESIGFIVKPFFEKIIIDPLNSVYAQMPFKAMRLDFALPAARIAIEVDGNYWHGSRQNSVTAAQLKRQIGDATKKTELMNTGWKLLTVIASDMQRPRFVKSFKNRILSLMHF